MHLLLGWLGALTTHSISFRLFSHLSHFPPSLPHRSVPSLHNSAAPTRSPPSIQSLWWRKAAQTPLRVKAHHCMHDRTQTEPCRLQVLLSGLHPAAEPPLRVTLQLSFYTRAWSCTVTVTSLANKFLFTTTKTQIKTVRRGNYLSKLVKKIGLKSGAQFDPTSHVKNHTGQKFWR